MAVKLYVGSDNWVTVEGLKTKSLAGDTIENAATVTAQVKDTAGNNVGSAATLSYVAASNGDYEGTLADDTPIIQGTDYDVVVTADAGAGKRAVWTERVVAERRPYRS